MQIRKLTAVAGGEKTVFPPDMRQTTSSILMTCQTLWIETTIRARKVVSLKQVTGLSAHVTTKQE